MKRRYLSEEEKMAIVLAGLKGEQSIAEICREHQISQSQYYKWRDRFLEAGKNALAYGVPSKKEAMLKAEIKRLQRIIGKQTVQIDVLKKPRSYLGQSRGSEGTGKKRLYDQRCLFWFRNHSEQIL